MSAPPAQITLEERIWGLSLIWSEAKYNFAYFERLPDLDWDEAYRQFLPRVEAAQNDLEYYELLEEFIALLRDGHTDIRLPGYLSRYRLTPPVRLRFLGDDLTVVDLVETEETQAAGLIRGSVLLEINGVSVAEAMERLRPRICANSPQGLKVLLADRLLEGEEGTSVLLKFRTPDGDIRECYLTRKFELRPWERQPGVTSRMIEEGIGLIAINSFGYHEVTDDFDWHLGAMTGLKGLIIDIRENRGGTTPTAIVSRLTDRTLRGHCGRTRQYLPAFRAWGSREAWYTFSFLVQPADHPLFLGPLVVLISEVTFSAAEDFLVLLRERPRTKFVGTPTAGSTGQPLIVPVPLPGGGGFRVCTVYTTYADGREFVGFGIQPDVEVSPTPQDIAAGRDVVLEKGLEVLREMIAAEPKVWRNIPLLQVPSGAGVTPASIVLSGAEGIAQELTVVNIWADERELHIVFNCQQRRYPLQAQVKERDGPVYKDDSVEIFIQPRKGRTYFHFAVNVASVQFDEQVQDPSWDGEWRAVAEPTTDGFRITVDIPFTTLGVSAPKAGERWRANFFRNIAADPNQASGWSFVKQFHSPWAFGVLVF